MMTSSLMLSAIVSPSESRATSFVWANKELVAQVGSTVSSSVSTGRKGLETAGNQTLIALVCVFPNFSHLCIIVFVLFVLINTVSLTGIKLFDLLSTLRVMSLRVGRSTEFQISTFTSPPSTPASRSTGSSTGWRGCMRCRIREMRLLSPIQVGGEAGKGRIGVRVLSAAVVESDIKR
jgi:hypothetical protein